MQYEMVTATAMLSTSLMTLSNCDLPARMLRRSVQTHLPCGQLPRRGYVCISRLPEMRPRQSPSTATRGPSTACPHADCSRSCGAGCKGQKRSVTDDIYCLESCRGCSIPMIRPATFIGDV